MATKPQPKPLPEEAARQPDVPRPVPRSVAALQTPKGVAPAASAPAPDFSLVAGGPLYQLYLRTRLARTPFELTLRRMLAICLFCWLPLLIFSAAAHSLWSGVEVPFLLDLGVHTRFLIALPMLIWAELFVHQRLSAAPRHFLDRGLIAVKDQPRFQEALASATRLRNALLPEILLLLVAFFGWYFLWKNAVLAETTWFVSRVAGTTQTTAAGYWYALVAAPILRFLVLRWYFRLFIWYRFLWQVRALPLQLKWFHPDRAGGLGFLAGNTLALTPFLTAQTVMLAGMIGNRICHAGASLLMFQTEMVGSVVFLLLIALAPLCFFVFHLDHAGRIAAGHYGVLASRYSDEFQRKWMRRETPAQRLLGTSDIQSLADLANSYEVASHMRLVPFSKNTLIRLALFISLPLAPLSLTMISTEQVVQRLFKLVF